MSRACARRIDLLVGDDQVPGRRRSRPEVVDPLEDDQPTDAGLCQHVAVEPRQGIRPQPVAQHPVAPEPMVQDADADGRFARVQAACEVVRPAAVAVGRRSPPVGDRIAENGDGGTVGVHVDAAQVVPVRGAGLPVAGRGHPSGPLLADTMCIGLPGGP